MILSDLTDIDFKNRIRGSGLVFCSGPFKFRIVSPIESVARGLRLLYADYPLGDCGDFVDFNVAIEQTGGFRRWWRPQASFSFNGIRPFLPLPLRHAYPLLEWAMNWCVSTQVNHYLMLHAAVIERDGCAMIMPAPPGSGKSTLCAGLISRGWRLLSDELALISLTDRMITPVGRPISLKNQSIDIIKKFEPDAVFNEVTHDTMKGSVSHMKMPALQLQRIGERAKPCWVVFPQYVPNVSAELTGRSKANSTLELAKNSFNYMVLGLTGFEILTDVVAQCECYDFRYANLEDAVAVFDKLVEVQRA
jgi:HprK-related kinase A